MQRKQDWTRYNQYLRKPYFYWDKDGLDLCCCINEPLGHSLYSRPELERPMKTLKELTADGPRHPFRLVIYKGVSVGDDWMWKLSHHRVNMGDVSACTQGITRYLFRFWHDESAGGNTEGCFKSEREKQGMCADLELMGEQDIQESLIRHLRNTKGHFQSPWVSLATSPLWVFSQALAVMEQGCQNLRLAIIDTWSLREGTYLFHSEALLRAYNVVKSLPFLNMGEPEVLVWKEIRAPMTVVRLDEFLPSVLERGYLKPGYLKLQPFHYKQLNSGFTKKHSAKRKTAGPETDNNKHGGKRKRAGAETDDKKQRSRPRRPYEIRKKICPNQTTSEAFLDIRLEQQAPWRFPRRHCAGRMSQGEQPGRKTGCFRVPMAAYQLDEYVEFLKREVPAVEFQFPMLIALLSTRTRELEYDSILDAIQESGSDVPMFQAHKQCIVSDSSASQSLPELASFERLFRDASVRLGIPVVKSPGVRNFWPLESPHTEIPPIDKEFSELALDVVQGREKQHMRLKEEEVGREEARQKEAEKDNIMRCRRQEAEERRKTLESGLLSQGLEGRVNCLHKHSIWNDPGIAGLFSAPARKQTPVTTPPIDHKDPRRDETTILPSITTIDANAGEDTCILTTIMEEDSHIKLA
ncbi:uncharacterized protein Z520_08326 [Fonsecaea multimorphosa CBS 102226]|uniref:DUF7587 domain-containing protein n=1 Tax=Fonsecaea multimorphosa CBS 102226 TaxID=1442371 RepID=A0A0D2IG87_9EURO|nr:uncharacterized protein Z520_08326 [Fonsecaea multimorphosa CBS 102226]KIX96071.1 hypothetical protein Z520_08326 [Fonsecaea multimorphosa CBS 102226]OAL21837.1 hypothetical protein AYO22_07779 [Fonsecaea multimorphosa]